MTHHKEDHNKNIGKNKDIEGQNERRMDQLIDIVEKHVRTERHLEQHSDIADVDEMKHAFEIQKARENEIDNLKNKIVYGEDTNNDEMKNLERNYNYTQGYLEHNAEHMEAETLERTIDKQENRKEQVNNKLFK